MRKRDRKRQAILDTAYRLFLEKGFERTSVSEINALVGGSKATIYSHFPSKEALFVECVFAPIYRGMDAIVGRLWEHPDEEVASVLKRFSREYLRLVCSPEMIAARRLIIAEAERGGVGPLFYGKLQTLARQIDAYISDLMRRGILRPADAGLAAHQLRTLVETELVEPLLLCALKGPLDDAAIAAAADAAVETSLKAYASPGTGS